jgi:hypothetical protein
MGEYKAEIVPSPDDAAKFLNKHDPTSIIAVFPWSDKGIAIIYEK